MAALPPVPGVVRVAMTGVLDLIPIATIFHMGYTGSPPSGTAVLGFSDAVASNWGTFVNAHLCNTCSYDTFTVTDLSSETGAEGIFEASHVGGASGVAVPNSVQLVISKAIARRYRGGHPRTYICGLPSTGLLDQTHWQTPFAIGIANAWSTFIQGLIGTVSFPAVSAEVCVHYIKNKEPLAFPLVDATQGAVGRALMGTQRRRLT